MGEYMGTHPIFESDFDCLTELGPKSHGWQKKQHSGQRPLPQGLEAKSPNLAQPARSKGATTDCSKGQGCRHRPRPAGGALRPVVRCQTARYNIRVRAGRGFTADELKGAGFSVREARQLGIAIDLR